MANENAVAFSPDDITLELGGETYRLYFDLNSYCEIEKMYDSVDTVLKMLLGTDSIPELTNVRYKGDRIDPDEVLIGETKLSDYINKYSAVKEAKYADTRNLLWAGCLHDHAIYNKFGEITGYDITKDKLGSLITLRNTREINLKIMTAILRDLLPSEEAKNVEAPTEPENPPAPEKPRLTLR